MTKGHCIYTEIPVILVNREVGKKNIFKKWRAKEEEMHKG
jgi:hypothetical protein